MEVKKVSISRKKLLKKRNRGFLIIFMLAELKVRKWLKLTGSGGFIVVYLQESYKN